MVTSNNGKRIPPANSWLRFEPKPKSHNLAEANCSKGMFIEKTQMCYICISSNMPSLI